MHFSYFTQAVDSEIPDENIEDIFNEYVGEPRDEKKFKEVMSYLRLHRPQLAEKIYNDSIESHAS